MNMEKISKAQVKFVRSLQLKKVRDAEGLFVAEGEKCVEELRRGFELVYYIQTAAKPLTEHRPATPDRPACGLTEDRPATPDRPLASQADRYIFSRYGLSALRKIVPLWATRKSYNSRLVACTPSNEPKPCR